MARNEEKAQSMLYRFREAMLIEAGVKRHPKDKATLVPATTNSIPIAEQGRRDLLKEIYRKIGRIQDKELEAVIVRSLNDEINEAIEQVKLWDERIRELGGLTKRSQRRIEEFEAAAISTEGKSSATASSELIQINGKYYFGRARELPEVQDYLKQRSDIDKEGAELQKLRKQRNELYTQVDHRYYGYLRNDLEASIVNEETYPPNKEIFNFDWITNQPIRKPSNDHEKKEELSELDLMAQKEGFHVPSQEEVQEYLLERRKQDLLNKYT